jgi:hypothetical protein
MKSPLAGSPYPSWQESNSNLSASITSTFPSMLVVAARIRSDGRNFALRQQKGSAASNSRWQLCAGSAESGTETAQLSKIHRNPKER